MMSESTSSFDSSDPLSEVRLSWVDDPNPSCFESHRALTRYRRELKMITDVMKEFSKRHEGNDESVLKKILEYGLKAQATYNNALHQWLENNPNALSRPVVQKLVNECGEREEKNLKKYFKRALREPDCRSEATVGTSSVSSASTCFSSKSIKIIQEQQREIARLKIQAKLPAQQCKVFEPPSMPVEMKPMQCSWPKENEMKIPRGMNENPCVPHSPLHCYSHMWEAPRRVLDEVGLCFYGKDASEYPAYRHRLLLNFNELRSTRPDLLLRWIESTVGGTAKHYVRNAFTVIDPGKACDVIWNTLEEIYGREDIILEHAMKQVKRKSRSINHERHSLLELRADLMNLQGVASSVSRSSALDSPALLGQLYSAFNEKLRTRFDAQYPVDCWVFEQFLQFLSGEISYIDSLHAMHVDVGDHLLKQKTPTPLNTRWRARPLGAAVEKTVKLKNDQLVGNVKSCVLHPETASHNLRQCRGFLNMTVDERWKLVKDHRLCFLCLGKWHTTKSCNDKSKQPCGECLLPHHTLLHKPAGGTAKVSEGTPSRSLTSGRRTADRDLSTKVMGYVKSQSAPDQICVMKMTAAPRKEKHKRFMFFAVIDTGATHSLCSSSLAERLWGFWKAESVQEYKLFNGSFMRCAAMNANLELEKANGDTAVFEDVTFINHKLPFSEYLPVDESGRTPDVEMVIGGDLAWKYILCDKSLRWRDNETSASHDLGTLWLRSKNINQHLQEDDDISGVDPESHNVSAACSKVRLAPSDRCDDVEKLEKNLLHRSSQDNKLAMSMEDEKVLKTFKETVKLVKVNDNENHLQFPLPWLDDPRSIQNNFKQAKDALLSLRRRLSLKPDTRSQYCKKIEAAIKEGHLVRIPDEKLNLDLNDENKPQYYIPHFNTAQAKFRVVYDAAREYKGVSLNKLLCRGPIFMQSLRAILIRFGERKHGIAGDIANMFFQIRIAPEDRDMIRILWFSEDDMQGKLAAYQFQVAPYGLRCIPSIAGYAMMFTAQENIPDASEDTTSRLTRDMFVDDFISSVDSVEDGKRVIKEISALLKSTGFTITKWNACCKETLANVKEEDLAPSIRSIQEKESGQMQKQTTLGLIWDTTTDEMFIKKPDFDSEKEKNLTKRQIVSLQHQIFDPLSWWAPFYVRMSLCCSKIVRDVNGWDSKVPQELMKDWRTAMQDLSSIETVSLPRCRVCTESSPDGYFEYHLFADSSRDIAAAALYLRTLNDNKWNVALVAAKTTILSQSEVARDSMPRKELIALDLGARLLRECLDSTTLHIQNFELWTDSKTVIQWCSQKSLELRVFERNRVDLILRNSSGKLPRYVASEWNPADVATRPFRISHKQRWNLWTRGPEFLWQQQPQLYSLQHFPIETTIAPENNEVERSLCSTELAVNCEQSNAEDAFLQHTLKRTNDLSKAIRVVINVANCVKIWRERVSGKSMSKADFYQKGTDFQAAKLVLIRAAQHESFGKVLKYMQEGDTFEDALISAKMKNVTPLSSIKKYVPFLDPDGILRVGGRLDYSEEMGEQEKHPAFLPQSHDVTRLFILNQHKKLGHRAGEMVLASLSQDAGVQPIGGIRTVRHHLANCFTCKLLQKSRAQQLMAPLPSFRIRPKQPVFCSTSIDYAGPYEVKRGRSIEKRWLCLFTCNATTAVRIEVVESLETTAFLNALHRFLCLTGNKTKHLRSDGASTFVGAHNVLQRELRKTMENAAKSADAQYYLNDKSISWDFSTPVSSHHQGLVERQIRTFKEVCEGVLGTRNQARVPSDFELLTLFREAEYIMNCRPIGKQYVDEDDIQPLRPLDLMTGYMEPQDDPLPMWEANPIDKLRRGHKFTRRLAQEWWERWLRRYPQKLQERHKWTKPDRNIQKGDLVLLLDATTPPIGRYPHAIVVGVKMCKDGKVRSVTVRMRDGRVRERDIRKIVLLEAQMNDPPVDYVTAEDSERTCDVDMINVSPKDN